MLVQTKINLYKKMMSIIASQGYKHDLRLISITNIDGSEKEVISTYKDNENVNFQTVNNCLRISISLF